MSDLNENIKNFRTFRGINQESLASLLGKTKSVISNWERGANSPDPDSIEALCKYLDVTPNQIFGWETNPEYEEWQKKISQTTGRIKMLKAKINSMNKEIEKLEREQAQLSMTDDISDKPEKAEKSEKPVLRLNNSKPMKEYNLFDIVSEMENKDDPPQFF